MNNGQAAGTLDARFSLKLALAMAFVLVAGFCMQLAMGRSSFNAPVIVHFHAVIFFGWVALFVAQTWFVARGPMALHRRLGWIGAAWIAAMIPLGFAVTINAVQTGRVPFFFFPQHFLIANPLGILCFAALAISAIALRRRTDWHRRLHIGAMASLLGPGFGRLLPMPLIGPFAFEITVGLGLLFPLLGMIRDKRRSGRIHPAWWWAVALTMVALIGGRMIAHSPLGDRLYALAVAGTPAADVPGLAFGVPPVP